MTCPVACLLSSANSLTTCCSISRATRPCYVVLFAFGRGRGRRRRDGGSTASAATPATGTADGPAARAVTPSAAAVGAASSATVVEAPYSALGWLERHLKEREGAPRAPRSLWQSVRAEMERQPERAEVRRDDLQ